MKIIENSESEVRYYCRKYPVVFQRAVNAEMFDTEGHRYIDFLASAGSLNYGHNNPYIKKAVRAYLEEDYPINMLDMATVAKTEFLESFTELILKPRNLDYKIMCCGPTGTNAIEAALKLARKNTGREGIIAFGGGFHGMTLGSLACTSDRGSRKGGHIPLPYVTHVPFEGTPGIDSIAYLQWLLTDDHSGVEKPAAIVLETVQAEGGINVASVEWLKALRQICTEEDILMIVDDIQVGNGRCGTFFSFERANIVPDIVVLSKSISGFGNPMAILLVKPEYDIFKPAEHNGTFRGNQLSFVGGKAGVEYYVQNEMEKETARKAEIIEEFIRKEILPIDARITYRGIGMIWGIDLGAINPDLAEKVLKLCFEKNMILESAGRNNSVVKLLPPLTIPDEILAEGLHILRDAICAACKA
ncbi:MAG: diaminobutyrate--2-oxoglutarate transaminase [bacterium]